MTTDQTNGAGGASATDPFFLRPVDGERRFDAVPVEPAKRKVRVTVVYARPEGIWQKELAVAAHADVATVLKHSGFAEAVPDYPLDEPVAGIFGRRCRLDEIVSDGDRIEIYRPLDFDPMESRRRRAAHRKAAATKAVFRPRRKREGEVSGGRGACPDSIAASSEAA